MRRPSLFILTIALAAASCVLPAHALSGPASAESPDSHASVRPSITVRVDDRHIAAPVRLPADTSTSTSSLRARSIITSRSGI